MSSKQLIILAEVWYSVIGEYHVDVSSGYLLTEQEQEQALCRVFFTEQEANEYAQKISHQWRKYGTGNSWNTGDRSKEI